MRNVYIFKKYNFTDEQKQVWSMVAKNPLHPTPTSGMAMGVGGILFRGARGHHGLLRMWWLNYVKCLAQSLANSENPTNAHYFPRFHVQPELRVTETEYWTWS